MKLYDFPWGPYPLRITIYLAQKGITDVELVKIEPPLDKAGWPPAFLKELTPSGSLPVIVDNDGTTIGQSLAILEYLEETKHGPDMIGATAAERARTREMIAVFEEAIAFFGLWSRHGSHLRSRPAKWLTTERDVSALARRCRHLIGVASARDNDRRDSGVMSMARALAVCTASSSPCPSSDDLRQRRAFGLSRYVVDWKLCEGASDRALALFSFESLAAYEQYRRGFGADPEFVEADRISDESGCVIRYTRSLMRPLDRD